VREAWWLIGNLSVIVFSVVALAHWKNSRDNPWQVLGLDLDRAAGVDLSIGFLIGALVMVGIFLVELTWGLIDVAGVRRPDLFILNGCLWFLPRAFAEELFCRGFLLNGLFVLVHGKYKWLAVAISAIVFGFIHALNPNANELSVLGNTLGGVVYSLAYLKSGRLWLGTGLHFAWNFVQGAILGFPVSGNATFGLLYQGAWSDILWTGGDYGPEAGLIGMGFRFVAIIAVLLWCARRSRQSTLPQP